LKTGKVSGLPVWTPGSIQTPSRKKPKGLEIPVRKESDDQGIYIPNWPTKKVSKKSAEVPNEDR
jgi:hypothetical protein